MRRVPLIALLLLPSLAHPQGKKAARDQELSKKETSAGPEKSLAGDITRKKEERGAAPALQYDQVRLGVEMQVSTKRRSLIEEIQKIIKYTENDPNGQKEMPKLLFRYGELLWEESKYFFFEANRKDDEYINAMNRKDEAGMKRAKGDKENLLDESKANAKKAMEQYSTIVQQYKDFERTDEVLYFLGHNLMEMGEDRKALVAFKRLIEKYPKSKYILDAHLAYGEYYFYNSKGKRDMLEKALESYQKAASNPENQVYGFALYKQGWCYFNLGDFVKSMDKFRAVVLYAKIQGADAVERDPKRGKAQLAREARNDFVRTFSRAGGSPTEAKAEFAKLADTADDRFLMMKQLANLYYEEGKDKEAALSFNMLIKEKPLAPEAPGFQGKIVDCVLRAGNKDMTVQQVRKLVKVMDDVNKSGVIKSEKDKKSLEEARELSERTISNLAVNWHNECRKTRDDECFKYANEVYSDYLTLFPENVKAYDLRFFWAELLHDNLQRYDRAADEYSKVVMRDGVCIDKGGGKAAPAAAEADKGEDAAPEDQEKPKEKKAKPGACPGRWLTHAAYNAILSYDEVVKADTAAGKIKAAAGADPKKKLEIPAQKKALLEACDRYLKYLPKGEKRVEIAFKSAKILLDHNYLDDAVPRLVDITLQHPDHKFENGDCVGEVTANLVLDAVIKLLGDKPRGLELAKKFRAEDRLFTCRAGFRGELDEMIEKLTFEVIREYEARKEYCKAADGYIQFVADFSSSKFSDRALWNASNLYAQCHKLDKTIEVRKRLIKEHPGSEFVPQAMFALAEGYEAITDFESAAEFYEDYAERYERSLSGRPAPRKPGKKGKKDKGAKSDERPSSGQVWQDAQAQIALLNAGVFREGLGQYKKALQDREKYLDLFGDKTELAADVEKVFLSIVDLHERNGAYGKATKQLEEYERKYLKDPNKVLTAEGRIATIYDQKQKSAKAARKVYERIWNYYDKLNKAAKGRLEISALDAVGRAHFVLSEDEYRRYSGMKVRWSKLSNVGEFKQTLGEKGKALQEIQKRYTITVTLKSADPAICALYKIGLAYDQFAKILANPPIPKGMDEGLAAEFKAQLESEYLTGVKAKATEAFQSAVAKSQELDVFNECTTKAYELLREYNPGQFPPMEEDVVEMKGTFRAMVIGQDLLTAIQTTEAVSPEKVAELKNKANEVARNVGDSPPAPPSRDESPGTKKPTPKPKTEEPDDEPI